MHLAPNSNGLLRRVGLYAEEIGGNLMGRLTEYDEKDNKIKNFDLTEANKIWQHPWHLIHRVRLHEALKKRAVQGGATLQTASKVVQVDPLKAVVQLENGEQIKGDVVVGADGIRVSSSLNFTVSN
jgi:2-polyprenyl-6-methoxyphenol hydroxylase-like FAD-dependent oxidoreductase